MEPTSHAGQERNRRRGRRLLWVAALVGTALAAGYTAHAGPVQPLMPVCGYPPPVPPSGCFTAWCCVSLDWEPCRFKAAGTACSDGSLCTLNDRCDGAGNCVGSAVVCQALDQCHLAGTCDPATGVCSNPAKPTGTPCNDGNACTYGDACNAAGLCMGTSIVCTAAGPCQSSTCNGTSSCTVAALARGTACPAPPACGQVCDGVSPYCQPAE